MHFVMDALTGYRTESPNVEVELTLDNRMPDLLEQGYDVSMVLASKLPDSGMVPRGWGRPTALFARRQDMYAPTKTSNNLRT